MRIDKLHIKNFRCFAEHTFALHPQFNVLIGGNGSGKTALLRALRVAVAGWLLGIKGRSTVHIRDDDVRLVGRAFEAGEYTFDPQWPVVVHARGTLSNDTPGAPAEVVEWKRSLNGPTGRTTYRHAKAVKQRASEADRRVREGEEVTLPALAYYSTSRLYLEPSQSEKYQHKPDKRALSRFVGYRDCIDKRLSTKAFVQWMGRQSQMAWQEGEDSTLYRLVRRAAASMVENATDVRFLADRQEVAVTFESGEVLPLDYLSDGQRATLTLAGDLAVRMVRLNPHLGEEALDQTPGVVLIDEIDMHLHPSWQRHIVADLKRTFPQAQFVVTTHSPQVISEIDEGRVLSLEREGPSVRAREEEAYGLDTNWVLEHLMNTGGRPGEIQQLLEKAERTLADENYGAARECLDQMRRRVRRPVGDAVQLRSKIETMEMLSEDGA